MKKNKWPELDTLDLRGWSCYLREPTTSGYLYHFTKRQGALHGHIRATFDNIEYQIEHNLTDTNYYKAI